MPCLLFFVSLSVIGGKKRGAECEPTTAMPKVTAGAPSRRVHAFGEGVQERAAEGVQDVILLALQHAQAGDADILRKSGGRVACVHRIETLFLRQSGERNALRTCLRTK